MSYKSHISELKLEQNKSESKKVHYRRRMSKQERLQQELQHEAELKSVIPHYNSNIPPQSRYICFYIQLQIASQQIIARVPQISELKSVKIDIPKGDPSFNSESELKSDINDKSNIPNSTSFTTDINSDKNNNNNTVSNHTSSENKISNKQMQANKIDTAMQLALNQIKENIAIFLQYQNFMLNLNSVKGKDLLDVLHKKEINFADFIISKYQNNNNIIQLLSSSKLNSVVNNKTMFVPIWLNLTDLKSEQGLFYKDRTYYQRIDGEPLGKERPRMGNIYIKGYKVTKRGKRKAVYGASVYTGNTTDEYENKIRRLFRSQMKSKDEEPITDPVAVDIIEHYDIKSSGTKISKLNKAVGSEYPTKKPDVDNVAKIMLDGMNPLSKKHLIVQPGFIQDDKSVVRLNVREIYDATVPYVETYVHVLKLKQYNDLVLNQYKIGENSNLDLPNNEAALKLKSDQNRAKQRQAELKQKQLKLKTEKKIKKNKKK